MQSINQQTGLRASILTFPWMFGRKIDLLFFFFPIVIGTLCFLMTQNSAVAASALWLFLALDAFGAGPFHFGPTWFAYFDKKNLEYWKSNRSKQLIFFLGPPLLIVLTTWGYVNKSTSPFVMLILTLWAVQHLVQQNIGILLLYHNQNAGEAIVNRQLEMRSQHWPAILFALIFLHRIYFNNSTDPGWLIFLALASVVALSPVALYLNEMRKQIRDGANLNVPAFGFWLISILCMVPFAFLGKNFGEAWVIPVTLHWFQYIGLNYALVKSKYSVNRSDLPQVPPLLLFFATCTMFFLIALFIFQVAGTIYGAKSNMSEILMGVWLGLTSCHYFLDAFLWRFREAHARQSILPHLMSYRKPA